MVPFYCRVRVRVVSFYTHCVLLLIGGLDTIAGGIIYLMVQTLNELHEVTPSDGDEFASYLLALFILTINWLTGIVYPMYRCVHFP